MKKVNIKAKKKIKSQKNKNVKSILMKGQNGITLIALIISIIVMLILAGVSLNATIGENGIISRAQESKLRKEEADVETEILSGLAALDTEYYEKVSADSGITISSIYNISGLSKYVKGKINGFSYNKNGTTTVYYTNSNGSYTITIDKNGTTKTRKGIYIGKNQISSIKLGKDEKINLDDELKNSNWEIVSGNATINSKTGEVTKNDDETVIISKKDENGNESTIIIKDSSNKYPTENNDVTNATENEEINDNIRAYIVPKDDGSNKLIIKGKGTIDDYEFSENINDPESISEIVIEEGIEKIEDEPFAEFTETKILTLPKSLKECTGYPFMDFVNLEKINFNCVNLKMSIEDEFIFDTYEKVAVNIGDEVEVIPENFFKEMDMESVILPDSTKVISTSAFYDAKIKYISFGNNIETIEMAAFGDCSEIKVLNLNEGLKNIGDGAFTNLSITELELPTTLENIGANAFYGCNNIKTLYYNSIHCSTKNIYDKDEHVSYYPFRANKDDDTSKNYNIDNVIIGDKVEYLDSDIFRKCNITTITIPSNVKYIAYEDGNESKQSGDSGAFYNCTFLKEIIVKQPENSIEGAPWSNVSGITVRWEP